MLLDCGFGHLRAELLDVGRDGERLDFFELQLAVLTLRWGGRAKL
jgi:hypothetical protein